MDSQENPNQARDPFNLNRFVSAQSPVYERALAELRSGRKRTHWMWYIFPQFDGLGFSTTALFYAIKSEDEARAYLRHPVLGARLEECSQAVAAVEGRSVSDIFGYPDDLKLHSCMTLFAVAAKSLPDPPTVFDRIITQYFDGVPDENTLALIGAKDTAAVG